MCQNAISQIESDTRYKQKKTGKGKNGFREREEEEEEEENVTLCCVDVRDNHRSQGGAEVRGKIGKLTGNGRKCSEMNEYVYTISKYFITGSNFRKCRHVFLFSIAAAASSRCSQC